MTSIFCTQYFAEKTNYHKALGNHILVFNNKKIYMPHSFYGWGKNFNKQLPSLTKRINLYFKISILIFLILIALAEKKKKVTFHGSAEWADNGDIQDMDLFNDTGLVVGKTSKGKVMRISEKTHIHTLMCAPTRMGKGINTVIPTALDWKDSIIFNDIKGELWDLTSGYRKNVLKQTVLMFNPLDESGVSCCYNPLDYIKIGTLKEMQDVEVIAKTMIDVGDSGGRDEHWTTSAINLINGIIFHIIYSKENPNLIDIIDFLTVGSLIDNIADIMGFPHKNAIPDEDGNLEVSMPFNHVSPKFSNRPNIIKELYGERKIDEDGLDRSKIHPIVAQEFTSIYNTPSKEAGSIISFATKRFKIFKDPLIAKHIKHSDFSVEDLMNHKTSLYLVTPPEALQRTKPLLRLIVCQTVYSITKTLKFGNRQYTPFEKLVKFFKDIPKNIYDYIYPPPPKNHLLFLLDEFRSLGKLELVEEAMTYIAGYGVRFLIILQSLKQLYKIYGDKNDIQDNCSCQIYLTPNDLTSAKNISELLGNKTTMYETSSKRGFESKSTKSTQFISQPLMKPDEVRRLPFEEIIVFMASHNPIRGKKNFYYQMNRYKKRLYETCVKSDSFREGKPQVNKENLSSNPLDKGSIEKKFNKVTSLENPSYDGLVTADGKEKIVNIDDEISENLTEYYDEDNFISDDFIL